mgnify:CR=1 FL=1
MSELIDARGLSCPQPVMMAKKALDSSKESELEIMVDNATARDNLLRLAKHSGCKADVTSDGEDFIVKITR